MNTKRSFLGNRFIEAQVTELKDLISVKGNGIQSEMLTGKIKEEFSLQK